MGDGVFDVGMDCGKVIADQGPWGCSPNQQSPRGAELLKDLRPFVSEPDQVIVTIAERASQIPLGIRDKLKDVAQARKVNADRRIALDQSGGRFWLVGQMRDDFLPDGTRPGRPVALLRRTA